MNLIVQRGHVHMLPVRTPTYARHWTPEFPDCDALFASLAVPYSHRSVVRTGRDELDARPACHHPVEGVYDPAVSVDLLDALPGGDVRQTEDLVCGDGVERGRAETNGGRGWGLCGGSK